MIRTSCIYDVGEAAQLPGLIGDGQLCRNGIIAGGRLGDPVSEKNQIFPVRLIAAEVSATLQEGIFPFPLAEGIFPSISGFMDNLKTYTRSEIMSLTGVDAKSLDYWAKLGVLQASEPNGGKGKHRKFSAMQVTLAAILFELQKLGLGGNKIQEISAHFNAAINWFQERDILDHFEAVEELFSMKQDLDSYGFANLHDDSITIADARDSFIKKMNREETLIHLSSKLSKAGVPADLIANLWQHANPDEYFEHAAVFEALSAKPVSYLNPSPLCVHEVAGAMRFEFVSGLDSGSYIFVDVPAIKRQLWGWP